MLQISEERLLESIELYREAHDQDPPGFVEAYMTGTKYKEQGLTPFYIYDEENGRLIVTSQENMDNRLH